ncbi:MAG: hypothetical protein CMQ19_00485 [Gammaproteobacteria bacterium]|nr:hypothetical protein [Gammaproteobacteria bacterium]
MKAPKAKLVRGERNPFSYLIGWYKPQVKGRHLEAIELAQRWLAKKEAEEAEEAKKIITP